MHTSKAVESVPDCHWMGNFRLVGEEGEGKQRFLRSHSTGQALVQSEDASHYSFEVEFNEKVACVI